MSKLYKWRWWIVGVLCLTMVFGCGWYGIQSANIAKEEQDYRRVLHVTDLNGDVAPDFRLTDQNGKTVSLSDFRGKAVVLQFMDPVCEDICPIVSRELVLANQSLGSSAPDVVYVAVNVNQYHEGLADLQKFSREHGLSSLHNWHFVTGSTKDLQAVWKAYGIVVKPNPDGDVQHSEFLYFIDPDGKERYIGSVDTEESTIDQTGQAIAYFAHKLT
jgi:cytochrome oxidase Cu insertion factor (SCO1/SenC/PrrC family)